MAARGGSTGATPEGEITSCMSTDPIAGAIGWYKVNSQGTVHPARSKKANPAGLYDLSGNVYEWVHDWYAPDLGSDLALDPVGPAVGTARIFRGGAWYFNADHLRSAKRLAFRPDKRFTFLGFRCARTK
jgi:formylglycine-generating enzyme required for sulfatase activity